jgi:1,4-dihydroxy-2-naphthoyl-CoA hydrolase
MPDNMADPAIQVPFEGTIHEALGIRTVEMSPERVTFEMDITPAVMQPLGLLHGGASAVLAESAASMAASLNCDPALGYPVGIDLNISHLRARRSGTVRATATPVRIGRTVQVWAISIEDQDGEPVAIARCTLAIKKPEGT